MIEHIGRVNMDFMVRLASDPVWAHGEMEAIEAYNREHGAMFGNEPVPVSIKPNFIAPTQERLMQEAASTLMGALDRFTGRFLESDRLQDLWGVTDEELDLYHVDPGYPGAIQVSRFDGFLRDLDLKFLEFNCDSPGGAGYGDVIHEAFLEMYQRNPTLDQGYDISSSQRCRVLHGALLEAYRAWRENGHEDHPSSPRVVVSDWPDVGSRPDIDITVRRLRDLGMDARFADPRDLTLDGDQLVHEGEPIDLIYKRVIVKELLAEPAASDVLDAYRGGRVCMVNSPRSVIVGNKKIMAALRMEEVQQVLSPEQRRAVERFVPWTQILQDGKVPFQGFRVDLRDFVLDNKDRLVLKAARGYGGKQVVLGFETDGEAWGRLVDKHLKDGTWVVQDMVEIPRELYPNLVGDEVRMDLMNVNINPFVFGGRYAGAYTRISKQNIINVSYGGGLAPTITATPSQGGRA